MMTFTMPSLLQSGLNDDIFRCQVDYSQVSMMTFYDDNGDGDGGTYISMQRQHWSQQLLVCGLSER